MKQVIIARTDLTLRKGKLASQVGHACVQSVMNYPARYQDNIKEWYHTGMSKIVVGCNSEDELYQLANKAIEYGLQVNLIKDAGLTEVDPGTPTVCAIGPDEDWKVDRITGHLKLL